MTTLISFNVNNNIKTKLSSQYIIGQDLYPVKIFKAFSATASVIKQSFIVSIILAHVKDGIVLYISLGTKTNSSNNFELQTH